LYGDKGIHAGTLLAHFADQLSLDQFQALLIPQSGGLQRDAFRAGPAFARRIHGNWAIGPVRNDSRHQIL